MVLKITVLVLILANNVFYENKPCYDNQYTQFSSVTVEEFYTMIFEDFLTLKGKDFRGRTLEDIWSFSDEEIENYHDFIQIVFPLNKPSQATFHVHFLDSKEVVHQIKNNKDATNNIIKSSQWFFSFLERNPILF